MISESCFTPSNRRASTYRACRARIYSLVIAMVLALPQSALAFKDGNDLLEALSSDNRTLQFGSIMFVTGAFEASRKLM